MHPYLGEVYAFHPQQDSTYTGGPQSKGLKAAHDIQVQRQPQGIHPRSRSPVYPARTTRHQKNGREAPHCRKQVRSHRAGTEQQTKTDFHFALIFVESKTRFNISASNLQPLVRREASAASGGLTRSTGYRGRAGRPASIPTPAASRWACGGRGRCRGGAGGGRRS